LAVLLALGITIPIVLPLCYGGMDSLFQLMRLSSWHIALLLGMVLTSWSVVSLRFRILLRPLGVTLSSREALATVVSAECAGMATPASTGNAATYLFLLSRRGLRIGQSSAVVAFDQMIDLAFFALAVPAAGAAYLLSHDETGASSAVAALVAIPTAVLCGTAYACRYYRPFSLWIARCLRGIPRSRSLQYRLGRWLIQFRDCIGFLLHLNPWRLAAIVALTAIHWMLRYSVLPLVILFLGHSVPWAYLFVGQSMMLIIGTLTFLPGGAGGVDLTLAALLHPHLPPAVAATAVLAWRFCMFHWYLIAGAPVFLATTGLGRGVRAPSTDLRAGAAENVGSVSRGCNADSPKEIDQP
jgi:uncharacterized protein (TIRG00374 family)